VVRRHQWILGLTVLGAAALSFGCALVWAIRTSHAQDCEAAARKLALALYAYRQSHEGCLPPPYIEDVETGERHSWRVILLPNVAYDFSYGDYSFQERWNSSRNRALFSRLTCYACPAHSRSPELTNYVAVVGDETFWPEPKAAKSYSYATVGEHDTDWPAPKGRNVMLPDWRTKIVLVELVDSDLRWMEPRDISLKEFLDVVKSDPRGPFYNKYVKGIRAIDADGQLRIINPYDDRDEIRSMFVLTTGERKEVHQEQGRSPTAKPTGPQRDAP
jgi:hypothetical protein